jgi:hypothetical protein
MDHADLPSPSMPLKTATHVRIPAPPNWLITCILALGGFQVWIADTPQFSDRPRAVPYTSPSIRWTTDSHPPSLVDVYTHDNVILMADRTPIQSETGSAQTFTTYRLDATVIITWTLTPEIPPPQAWLLTVMADHRYQFRLAPDIRRVGIPLLLWPKTTHWTITLSAITPPSAPPIPTHSISFPWNPETDYPDVLRSFVTQLEIAS